ncbi:hypothetical protein VZC37_15495 [Gordonia sp. LSe1-13]|uniref:ABC transporter permease n=1 Tax=Gordonia sesuvii TaxID=3116777 RepID=A0ABU7MGM7_9ACTN|nr:hypothetical protein [Gordonia sp. LSe1-13]
MTGMTTAFTLCVRLNYRGAMVAAAGVVACFYAGILGLTAIYPTVTDRIQYALITDGLRASQALQGPPVGLVGIGGITTFEVGWFVTFAVALLNIVLVVRNTRSQEALGRLELLRSGRFALLANSVAVGAMALVINVTIGIGATFALIAGGGEPTGAFAFGVATVLIGTMFAAIALLAAQITEHSKGAYGIACGVLGVAYLLRALGDATDSDSLRYASPLGLAQAIHPYGNIQWWPVIPCLIITVTGVLVALRIELTRDHGSGLWRPSPGPAHAGWFTRRPAGLVLRNQRMTLAIWAATMVVLGLGFGVTARDVGDISDGPAGMRQLLERFNVDVVDGFLAMSTLILAVATTGAAIAITAGLRSEELAGRADLLLSGLVPRWRLPVLHLALAAVTAVVLAGIVGV